MIDSWDLLVIGRGLRYHSFTPRPLLHKPNVVRSTFEIFWLHFWTWEEVETRCPSLFTVGGWNTWICRSWEIISKIILTKKHKNVRSVSSISDRLSSRTSKTPNQQHSLYITKCIIYFYQKFKRKTFHSEWLLLCINEAWWVVFTITTILSYNLETYIKNISHVAKFE